MTKQSLLLPDSTVLDAHTNAEMDLCFFIARLWKFNCEKIVYRRNSFPHSGRFRYRLKNKNGDWMYLKETFFLPKPLTTNEEIEDEKSEGQFLRNSLGSVLMANLDNGGTYLCI